MCKHNWQTLKYAQDPTMPYEPILHWCKKCGTLRHTTYKAVNYKSGGTIGDSWESWDTVVDKRTYEKPIKE